MTVPNQCEALLEHASPSVKLWYIHFIFAFSEHRPFCSPRATVGEPTMKTRLTDEINEAYVP
jgi:hypothetical protein